LVAGGGGAARVFNEVIAQDLRRQGPVQPILRKPRYDKQARLVMQCAPFEAGHVLLISHEPNELGRIFHLRHMAAIVDHREARALVPIDRKRVRSPKCRRPSRMLAA
jgi:hypothetical protein